MYFLWRVPFYQVSCQDKNVITIYLVFIYAISVSLLVVVVVRYRNTFISQPPISSVVEKLTLCERVKYSRYINLTYLCCTCTICN